MVAFFLPKLTSPNHVRSVHMASVTYGDSRLPRVWWHSEFAFCLAGHSTLTGLILFFNLLQPAAFPSLDDHFTA
jgi:hypothetical protein